jgi:phosphatidate cytidylyltransferase
MFTIYTPAYAIIMAAVAGICVYEMLKVFGVKNIPFFALCELAGAGVVIYADYRSKFTLPMFPVLTGLVLLSLIFMVLDHKRLRFEQVVCGLFSALMIPAALSCVVLFRDVYVVWPALFTKSDGVFFIIFAFFCSWMTDGFALFAGKALGKHKLAPNISPNKTVEGAVGGVLGNLLFCIALWAVFKYKIGISAHINIVWVVVTSLCLAVVSIFGDLAASTIKRHHGVKDFGKLLPGHGGVMDRFDSSVFVFAALYATVCVMGTVIG